MKEKNTMSSSQYDDDDDKIFFVLFFSFWLLSSYTAQHNTNRNSDITDYSRQIIEIIDTSRSNIEYDI